MELTPEERQKIYLEEKARLEIRQELEASAATPPATSPAPAPGLMPPNKKMSTGTIIWWFVGFVVLVVLMMVYLGAGSPVPHWSSQSVGSNTPAVAKSAVTQQSAHQQKPQEAPEDYVPMWLPVRYIGYLTPTALLKAYEMNEIAANQFFKDKWVWLRGGSTVDKIGRDLLGKPYITLFPDHDGRSVQAFFQSDSDVAKLQRYDEISITGTCAGLMINVILQDCVIHDPVWRAPPCTWNEGCPGSDGYVHYKEVHLH